MLLTGMVARQEHEPLLQVPFKVPELEPENPLVESLGNATKNIFKNAELCLGAAGIFKTTASQSIINHQPSVQRDLHLTTPDHRRYAVAARKRGNRYCDWLRVRMLMCVGCDHVINHVVLLLPTVTNVFFSIPLGIPYTAADGGYPVPASQTSDNVIIIIIIFQHLVSSASKLANATYL
jgi:hypothetical protein